jgi:hypothetical protein
MQGMLHSLYTFNCLIHFSIYSCRSVINDIAYGTCRDVGMRAAMSARVAFSSVSWKDNKKYMDVCVWYTCGTVNGLCVADLALSRAANNLCRLVPRCLGLESRTCVALVYNTKNLSHTKHTQYDLSIHTAFPSLDF